MKRFLRAVPFLILGVALFILARELRHIRWADLRQTLLNYEPSTFVLATVLLGLNYVIWSGYDWTSLAQLKRRVPYVQILRTTSVAFPITNLVGYSLITGFATRVRSYEPLGITYGEITKIILFNLTTWWMGFLFLCGLSVAHSPSEDIFKSSPFGARPVGFALLALVGAYLVTAWWTNGRELRWRRFHMHLPSLRYGLVKILISSADNMLVGLTLFVFLPMARDVSLPQYLAYFFSANLAALLTFVPAGWGVLEGALLFLFRPYATDAEIFASLVLFRVFHYLLPVGLAFAGVALRKTYVAIKTARSTGDLKKAKF